MNSATAAARGAHAAPLGTGHLHRALEDARDLANLQSFCRALTCAAADVSSDGIHLDVLRVLDVMRQRGYGVGRPAPAPCQVRKGRTIWHVSVTLPAGGPSLTLGFYTPNTS